MYGTPDQRESAAAGLGELISLTTPAALKPFLIKITGPLIRLVGDKFPWQVKAAILGTLSLLLKKGGIMLKPFLPQLQTSFIKALKDPSDLVRKRGGQALTQLTGLNPRVDLLCNELLTGSTTEQETDGVQESMLATLDSVVLCVGKKMKPDLAEKMLATLVAGLDNPNDEVREGIATALGGVAAVVSIDLVEPVLQASLLPPGGDDWQLRHGRVLAIAALLRTPADVIEQNKAEIQEAILQYAEDDTGPVLQGCATAIGRMAEFVSDDADQVSSLRASLEKIAANQSSEVRKMAAKILKEF
jgi:HEAT repeat protein